MLISILDLGSSQIKSLVAESKKDGKLSLLGAFKMPVAGFRKGEVADLDEVSQSVGRAISEIKQISKNASKNVFINVGGGNVKIQESRGIVAVSRADSEVYQEDVDRVIKASQAINLGHNRMILHNITREFVIDGVEEIRDPLGMIGSRLEINSLIFDAFKPNVNNLVKSVESAGGKVDGLIYNPLAASRSVLSKNQKELGVALVDIGSGTTSVAVYEEGKLITAIVFPVGAGHVTNDLAIGIKCPVKTAETIKLSFGCALAKEVSIKEKINLYDIDESLKSEISRRFISEIIESRLTEIFEIINAELKQKGKMGKLPAGVVIVGGGAKLPRIVELAKQELKLSAQIGIPEIGSLESTNAEFKARIEDPEFAVASGLLLCGHEQISKDKKGWAEPNKSFFRKIFKYFLP